MKLSPTELRKLNNSLKESGLKFCNQCSTEKPFSEFKMRRHDGRLDGECLQCSRKRNNTMRSLERDKARGQKAESPIGDDEDADPFVVDSLVQRYPMPEARRCEIEAAALIFYERGMSYDDIALVLRLTRQDAERCVDAMQYRNRRRAEKSLVGQVQESGL